MEKTGIRNELTKKTIDRKEEDLSILPVLTGKSIMKTLVLNHFYTLRHDKKKDFNYRAG